MRLFNKYEQFMILLLIVGVSTKMVAINRVAKSEGVTMNQESNTCTAVGSNNSTVMGFGNCYNNIYYINMQIGTPPRTMGFQFDTGSNIMWIPTTKANATEGFNPKSSSTFTITNNSYSITYADGSSVNGYFGSDVVAVSGTPISQTPQILWVQSYQSMGYPSQIQGLVGMGFTTTPNFLDLAYSKGQIDSPVFALQIQNQTYSSYIYYDTLPAKITSTTYYVPVVGNTYWQVSVVGVTIGGIDMTSSSASVAVIDSGTSYFYLNSQLFNRVISNFFGACNNNNNPPTCPCNMKNLPTFAFMFEGIQVFIQSFQYMDQLTPFTCTYNFGTLSTVSQILLGDIFFRGYIVTFDKPNARIGFAGNLNKLQSAQLKGALTASWVLLGILLVLFIFGIVVYCCLRDLVKVKNIQSKDMIELTDISSKPQTRFNPRERLL